MSLPETADAGQWRSRAASFGAAAALYDEIRPGYPRAALDWGTEPLGVGRWRVLDVGAGTGIMTRLIIETGHDVVAVEPDPQMRDQLARTTSGVTLLDGSAEGLPLPDASVDAAVAAQAYHWFHQERAHAELARVIRPGGVFIAVWNDHDRTVDWVAEYSRIEGDDGRDDRDVADFGPDFDLVELATFNHSIRHTADTLVRLMRSRSRFLVAEPEWQATTEAGVRAMVATHPDLAGRAEFDLPYVTIAVRGVRR